MAFVFKNPNSKFWLAGFIDTDGKRHNRSTKVLAESAASKREAERIAQEYEEAGNRVRTAIQVRRVISDLHKKITGEDLPVVSLAAQVDQWIESKRTSVAPATVLFYEGATKKFVEQLGKRAKANISDITRIEIERFRDSLAKKVAPKTVNGIVKVLKMLFKDARDRTLLLDDPSELVKPVKSKKVVDRRPFTVEEIKSILPHCDTEWHSMVLFGLYTGQRLGDIARLKWDSVDLEKGTLRLTTSKTGKSLNLPLHADLLKFLKENPTPISRTLPIHPAAAAIVEKDKRTSHLSNCFGRILAAAGLRDKRPHRALGNGRDGKRDMNSLSFHSLRRTATTLLHEAGVSQAVAMALIGHDSEDIHAIYVNVGEAAMREASKKLPSLSATAVIL